MFKNIKLVDMGKRDTAPVFYRALYYRPYNNTYFWDVPLFDEPSKVRIKEIERSLKVEYIKCVKFGGMGI